MKSNVRAVTPKPEEKPEAIDREKTCPLLLRVFTGKGKFSNNQICIGILIPFRPIDIKMPILERHHRPDDFSRNQTPPNELQVRSASVYFSICKYF